MPTIETIGPSWAPRLLSVLRFVVGLLFLEHGLSKLFGFPPVPEMGKIELISLIGLSGILEFVGGLLLILGLFTRPTAFILSGEKAARAAAAMGTGTRAALADCTISDKSLCARSTVNPGVVSPANTLFGQFTRSWPLVAVVP